MSNASKLKQPKLSDLMRKYGISRLAKKMGVSAVAVSTWVKLDTVSQRKALSVAVALDQDPLFIQSFVKPITYETKKIVKDPSAYDTILAAYYGKPYEIKPPMTERSLLQILNKWGDKVPLLIESLRKVITGDLNVKGIAKILGMGTQEAYDLMSRYGVPASKYRVKKQKEPGHYTLVQRKVPKYVKAIIEGTMTRSQVIKETGISSSTIYRYVSEALNGYTLYNLTWWPASFRFAYAHEIDKGLPRLVPHWVKMCNENGWKRIEDFQGLGTIDNWRLVTTRRLLMAVLFGEISVNELAQLRDTEPALLHKLFDRELAHLGLTAKQAFNMSIWHQYAIMDMLRMSEKR